MYQVCIYVSRWAVKLIDENFLLFTWYHSITLRTKYWPENIFWGQLIIMPHTGKNIVYVLIIKYFYDIKRCANDKSR